MCTEVLESAKAFEKHLLSHHNNSTQLHISTSAAGSVAADITALTSPSTFTPLSSSEPNLSPMLNVNDVPPADNGTIRLVMLHIPVKRCHLLKN